jgi:hypothetical protein
MPLSKQKHKQEDEWAVHVAYTVLVGKSERDHRGGVTGMELRFILR